MAGRQQNRAAASPLPPFPEGWYFIASRREVLKAKLIEKTWMGEDVVVWCDDDGRVCVAEAYCPHLGSSLGPDGGGRVCEGRLVCPFHGFEFDGGGQCVATPFAAAPRSARLQVYETQEVSGLIFAWWGIEGREPQWRVPDEQPEQAGWSGIHLQTLRFPGHVQEAAENSVDIAHLRYVHGYGQVNGDYPVVVDGSRLETRFDFRRTQSLSRIASVTLAVSAHTRLFGFGYSFVEGQEHSIGLDFRLWVLATPVDGRLIDLTLATQVREMRRPKRPIVGLRFLPTGLRAPLMNRILAVFQKRDVEQDVIIWGRKRYRARPRLCRSDGEIMTYRAWCAQFYAGEDEVLQLPREQADSAQAAGS